ncbi:hypothetical protein ENSA5_44790 [Enhygromyxa salina]|uniref:Uncharacterized protein n=1 Tax=Enhygromyxa salina TaxID=215803 RepID=A0A2S9XK83_9BACT|nr:right-handed parallel beta-helix repeat-containing protein [Enhygromyxa salina]PRP93140.1 hypothetical protein ENSA5_44790 [Enhygromyxa salina]
MTNSLRLLFGTCLILSPIACGDSSATDGEGASETGYGDGDGDGDPGDGDGDPGDGDGDPGDGDTGDGDTGDGDTGDGDTGDGDMDCGPIGEPPPEAPIVMVAPADAGALPQMVAEAEPNTTFMFADGTYDLSGGSQIQVRTPGLRFVGASNDRDAVILDADYGIGEIFLVTASDTTIAHMTLQRATWHPIHVTGGDQANTENTMIYDVAVIDPGEQAIKINASGAGYFSDYGTVACSSVVMTDAGRAQVQNCYTGGVDAHSARGWVVRDNYFEGFWCDVGLSEHAVHFWITGRDTVVERNTIVDCARGVGFGLGQNGNGKQRVYDDDPCPGADYLGHVDGVIRDNMIFAGRPELFASQSGFDSGVALEQACGTVVAHNTVASLQPPFVAMEYRFPNTDATIVNNLTTHGIVMRDGGQASLVGNLEDQGLEHFVDAAGGDLHLVEGSAAVDAGDPSGVDWAPTDYDGDARDGAPDVGADELP